MRTHGVNQAFRFVGGIWLHRKSRQLRFFSWKWPNLHHTCATYSELLFYMITMGRVFIVHGLTERKVKILIWLLKGIHSHLVRWNIVTLTKESTKKNRLMTNYVLKFPWWCKIKCLPFSAVRGSEKKTQIKKLIRYVAFEEIRVWIIG